jgi:biopolymer transport protein ExbB
MLSFLCLAIGKLRSAILSSLLGMLLLGFQSGAAVLLTASPVQAQEDAEGAKPAESINPASQFIKAMFHGPVAIMVTLMIIAISIGMVALVIIMLLDLRLGEAVPPSFVEEFTEMVNKRQFKQAFDLCRNEATFIARVLTAGMGRLQYGIEDAREAMAAMNDSVKASKDAWISYLGIVGTLGPLLGLVGTVSGMIGAFQELGKSDKAPEASKLALEISSALVLTLLGVAIAVPAIFFFTFFRNRLTNIAVNVSNLSDDLLTQMYHNSKKAGATPGPAESTGVRAKS